MTISTTIKSIQDIMRKDVGVDGDAQRIGQLGWMLFLKIFDDREKERELLEEGYRSPIPAKLRWRNWAADPEGMTGDELLDFVNGKLFPTLKELPVSKRPNDASVVVRGVFEDAYNYMKSGTLLRQVINKINEIDFNRSTDRHVFGDLYEKILKDLQSAGNAGEYYTPRAVTRFMVEMTDPRLGEQILDPACGTGGFLVNALEYIRERYVTTPEQEAELQRSIHGVEKKPLPHLLCTTNLLLHQLDVPTQVRRDNTLARPLRDYGPKDKVDVILTNPPFGGEEELGIESNFPKVFQTRETADLFLVFIMQLLRDGGRAAVVLPDGFLFGEGVKTRIKEQLLRECDLHTIVRLPKGVFAPYTSINTNLLFFTKGSTTRHVWYYEHPYPDGQKSYSKTKPIRIEEFAAEQAWWERREENEHAWKVSAEAIKARAYNLDVKNPRGDAESYREPGELLTEYKAVLAAADRTREALLAALQQGARCASDLGSSRVTPGMLLEEFATVSNTTHGIQRLRELIVQLAVRGRLVPQDPRDESASILLTRIKGQSSSSSTSETMQRIGRSLAIDQSAIPPDLPRGWTFVRLGEVADHRLGKMLDRGKNTGELHPYLRNTNVQWLRFDLSDIKQIRLRTDELEEYRVRRGDLMVCEGGEPGRCAIWNDDDTQPMFFQKALHRVRPHKGISTWFILLNLWADAQRGSLAQYFTGATIKHMTGQALARYCFRLAPEAEQERIVTRTRFLMSLCDELEAHMSRASTKSARLAAALVHRLTAV